MCWLKIVVRALLFGLCVGFLGFGVVFFLGFGFFLLCVWVLGFGDVLFFGFWLGLLFF